MHGGVDFLTPNRFCSNSTGVLFPMVLSRASKKSVLSFFEPDVLSSLFLVGVPFPLRFARIGAFCGEIHCEGAEGRRDVSRSRASVGRRVQDGIELKSAQIVFEGDRIVVFQTSVGVA